MRNAMDAGEFALGWWPGDPRYGKAAFYAYAHPAPANFGGPRVLTEPVRWEAGLGEYVLDLSDVCQSTEPEGVALCVRRSAFRHTCLTCNWEPALLASAEGSPAPVR